MKRVISTAGISREEWHRLRKNGLGGSDAAVVLGISPFKSSLELWYEKANDVPESEKETEASYWGKQLEPIVRDEFSARTGIKVYQESFILQHAKYPFMQANLDGYVYDSVYGTCVFEAKTASAYKASDWADGVPEEYYAQLQHYMAVTGYKGAYIAALIGGNHFVWKFVERDKNYIQELIRKEKQFWKHVQDGTEPPVDGTKVTTEFLNELYPHAEEVEVLELPEDTQQWIDLYFSAKESETKAKADKCLAENQLKALLQNRGKAVLGHITVCWPEIVSEKFDSKQFKIDEPEMYEQYMYKTQYRKFTVQTQKGGKTLNG